MHQTSIHLTTMCAVGYNASDISFLADCTNSRAIGTVLRLSSVCLSVCDVMYCG